MGHPTLDPPTLREGREGWGTQIGFTLLRLTAGLNGAPVIVRKPRLASRTWGTRFGYFSKGFALYT
jgi:hypothetical protein